MMARTKAAVWGGAGLLVIAIAAGPIVRSIAETYAYYGWKRYPPYRWRLTVELSTPAGLRRTSGVYENQDSVAGRGMRFARGSGSSCVQGDAIPIPIDRRSTVYVLPWREDNWDWARYAPQAILATPIGDHAQRALAMARLRGSAVLPRDNNDAAIGWPTFIRLPGESGRALLPIVDPDDLGSGVRVVRVIVSMTRDPVSRPLRPSIKKLLERLPAGTDSARAEYLSQPTSSGC